MPERSLAAWLQHLEGIHPAEIDLGLGRTTKVARELGLLPFAPTVLTIAGTNGKGTVAHTSDALLRAHGLHTGRYTSPHLLDYNERVCVDGIPVEDALIVQAFEDIERTRGEVTLTYFEFSTLAALWIFRHRGVDAAILEVGLGGRLDAVNIVDCDVAVITAIALDHQHWLGDTLDAIAPEKAAVARAGKPVVLAEHSYPRSLGLTLKQLDAAPIRAGDEWRWQVDGSHVSVRLVAQAESLRLPCPDGLRHSNIAAAVQASACVLGKPLVPQQCEDALMRLSVPGRRQRITVEGRELILDVAHNPAAMESLVAYLQAHACAGKTVALLGLMADKDLPTMAEQLATVVDGAWAAAIPGIERAQDPELVWDALDGAGIAAPQSEFALPQVWQKLLAATTEDDRIVVCGSFHTVAGIMGLSRIRPYGVS